MGSLFAFLTLIAIFGGVTWVIRSLSRISRKRNDQAAPTLSDVLAVQADSLPPLEECQFRQPHGLQLAFYLAATGLLAGALLWSLAAHGWSLLGIILGAAEVLLLFVHGAPLAVNIARSVRVTPEGIETKGLLKRRSISWWEIQSFKANEDLSGFRVDGRGQAFAFDTAGFNPAARLAMYTAIRANLQAHQQPLSVLPRPSPAVRFVKSNALSLGIFLAVAFAATFTAEQFLPEGNVLGLRCSYASGFLREKYGLPERHGCVILRVNPGTGAYEAGLREGDMIVALEGVPITSGPQFSEFWYSLDKHTQSFTIVRPGEPGEMTFKVTLGGPGRIATGGPDNPLYYYLRARGAEDRAQAVKDYTRAIELAPGFDLAYAYRGRLYNEDHRIDLAIADLDKALELDPELTEAYRERAWYYVFISEFETAAQDAETAIELDGCEGSFKTYNYDCHRNYLVHSMSFGERGDPDSLERAVEEARRAIEYYPERPRSYYLAAFYLEATAPLGAEPQGEPSILAVRFATERSREPPQEVRSMAPDGKYVWAYFEFENAAEVMGVSWTWMQNSEIKGVGYEAWPSASRGKAWLRLENEFPGEDSENTLSLFFDDREPVTTNLLLRDEAFVGPITFSADPEGTQLLRFYTGQPGEIFAHFEYAGALPDTTVSWFADKDGAMIVYGDVKVGDSGDVTAPITLPPSITPGIVDLRVYVDGALVRSGALAVTTPAIAAAPPFDSFEIGMGNDGNGDLLEITREISRNSYEVYYSIRPLRLQPGSSLSTAWYHNGDLYGPPQTILSSDNYSAVLDIIPGSLGSWEPGEYRVIVSLDTQPVYAEVMVVR